MRAKPTNGIGYALCRIVSLDQLIAKLQKLSAQVEKGMSKQGFSVWVAMIREDLYKISSPDVRKGALKMLGVVECAGFCLDRAPEARETLILPNLKPLIEFLKDNGRKTVQLTEKAVEHARATEKAEGEPPFGFNPS